MNQLAGFAILLFASLLLIVSSVTNVKITAQGNGTNPEKPASEKTFTRGPSAETTAGANCPAGEVKDYTGACSKESEAKAYTCNPGSAAVPEIMAEYQSDKIVQNPNKLQSDTAKLQSDVIQVKNDIINLQPETTQVKPVLQSKTVLLNAPSVEAAAVAACRERVPKLPKGPLSREFLNTLKGRGPHDVVTLYDQLKASIKAQSEACDAQSKTESIQQMVAKLQAQRPQPKINLESYNKLQSDTAKLQSDKAKLQSDENKYFARQSPIQGLTLGSPSSSQIANNPNKEMIYCKFGECRKTPF